MQLVEILGCLYFATTFKVSVLGGRFLPILQAKVEIIFWAIAHSCIENFCPLSVGLQIETGHSEHSFDQFSVKSATILSFVEIIYGV